jgi:hypothetical protein
MCRKVVNNIQFPTIPDNLPYVNATPKDMPEPIDMNLMSICAPASLCQKRKRFQFISSTDLHFVLQFDLSCGRGKN